jgi:hypothetical protein
VFAHQQHSGIDYLPTFYLLRLETLSARRVQVKMDSKGITHERSKLSASISKYLHACAALSEIAQNY